MAKYIKREMADVSGSGKNRTYYRLKVNRNLTTDEFIDKLCFHNASMTKGMATMVLMQVAEELAMQMADGYTVTIDGIGTFGATIGLRKGKEMDGFDADAPKRNASSLQVNGIHYKADRQLILNTDKQCELERAGESRLRVSRFSKEERLALAQKYLEEHPYLRIADYVSLTGLSRTTASMELRDLSRDVASGIAASGRGSYKVYVKRG